MSEKDTHEEQSSSPSEARRRFILDEGGILMATQPESYPARLDIDYPEKLDRLTTFFRLLWAIPILIVLSVLSAPPPPR
jgi:hypothetical protein